MRLVVHLVLCLVVVQRHGRHLHLGQRCQPLQLLHFSLNVLCCSPRQAYQLAREGVGDHLRGHMYVSHNCLSRTLRSRTSVSSAAAVAHSAYVTNSASAATVIAGAFIVGKVSRKHTTENARARGHLPRGTPVCNTPATARAALARPARHARAKSKLNAMADPFSPQRGPLQRCGRQRGGRALQSVADHACWWSQQS